MASTTIKATEAGKRLATNDLAVQERQIPAVA